MAESEKSTCMAVARVWVNGLDIPLSSYEEIPVKPDELPTDTKVLSQTITNYEESITWNLVDGTVCRKREYDTTIWWKKPTLADAITNKRQGEFWQFFSDGAVLVKDADGLWFWSEDYAVYPLRQEEEFDNDSCGCGDSYRCCGYDHNERYSRD